MSKLQVLVVEDDPYICEDIATSLNQERFETDKAFCGDSAFALFTQKKHQIVLTDLQMKNGKDDGFILLEKVKAASPATAVMIITSLSDVPRAVKAMQLGALDYVTKPYDAEQLAVKVEKIADRVVLENENASLRRELLVRHEIAGLSDSVVQLKRKIGLVASADSCVLITGPNGSGKELVAWSLRNQSKRKDKPFETLNCAAIPDNLIESELFGTTKGAFTGALDKKGIFELAHEGTLFLDEIGDMSPLCQAKVLRVLETGVIRRVGGTADIKTDVRVIAATNKNIEELIENKLFRRDLYDRLNVIPLETTPLCKRREDIPVLIDHLVAKMRKNLEAKRVFQKESIEFLASCEWPGNVRELKNVIERLLIFWDGKPVGVEGVKQYMNQPNRKNATLQTADAKKTLKEASNNFERDFIKRVLDECSGNVTEAAQTLGLQRSYLYDKMKNLGMEK